MTVPALAKPHDSLCGAKTREGAKYPTCHRPAGWGTDHPGVGRCKLHGGKTPARHGRYSGLRNERLRVLIEAHETDPDPLNVLPELAAARALFQDFVERYDEHTAALLAWHASFELQQRPLPADKVIAFERVVDEWENAAREGAELTEQQEADLETARKFVELLRGAGQEAKPRRVLDLSDAYRIVGEITKIVERIERARSADAISRPELNRLVHEMARVVDLNVADQEVKARIRDGWLALAV